MGRASNERKAIEWRQRIGRWRRSGLSIAEFTRREQVSQPSFYAWRKRLRERSSHPQRPVFVPVELSAPTLSRGGIQIELPGGAVVMLPAEASAALVTTAIRAAMNTAAMSGEDASC
jgi:transposase